MKPLNPGDVIWLSGSATEIDAFLKSPAVKDRAVFLGSPDDPKRCLMLHVMPGPLGQALQHHISAKSVSITFLLLEGKVVGLIREPSSRASDKESDEVKVTET